jgi:hypothetical protein
MITFGDAPGGKRGVENAERNKVLFNLLMSPD